MSSGKPLVVAAVTMTPEQYRKHLANRHIRIFLPVDEHDESHGEYPADYNHEHEE